ncbi:probable serine/threonine-protein kinase clkA [Leptopilina heterotoma]|uniref:probable serine/threonine-protein kinase clkA n=1 Tax=Leptopilina heterotoma TaxID=63436 RepID=UPI001CA8C31F|nr:probable serine/threonine-protein kinase clkA [Leptopilina heterotoma]
MELKQVKNKSNPENGDVDTKAEADSNESSVTDPTCNVAGGATGQILSEKEVVSEINDLINDIKKNTGVSPVLSNSGPGNNNEVARDSSGIAKLSSSYDPNHSMTATNNNHDKDRNDNFSDKECNNNTTDKENSNNDSFDKDKNSKKNDSNFSKDDKENSKNEKSNDGDLLSKNDGLTKDDEENAVGFSKNLKRQLNGDVNSRCVEFKKLENRIDNKIAQLEQVMDSTLSMHSKMQESMKQWFERCNSDNQAEANCLQVANKNHPGSKPTAMASVQFANSNHRKWANERCFECDDMGHMQIECPLKG